MLSDKHLDKYADVLLWGIKKARIKKFRKNDIVMVRFDLGALKLAEILQAKLLGMGMNPILRFNTTPTMDLNFYGLAHSNQLLFQPPAALSSAKISTGQSFLTPRISYPSSHHRFRKSVRP